MLFFFLACISFLVYGLLLNDSRFDEVIMHYINRGKGINIKTSKIVAVIYTYFGRKGCITFIFLGSLLIYNELFKEIQTLRRYLRKEKLYKMGLVSDMDDDEKPKGFIKSIIQLFHKSKIFFSFCVKIYPKEIAGNEKRAKRNRKKT